MVRFFKPLPDFRPSDLPAPPRSFWQLAGPGAVLSSLSCWTPQPEVCMVRKGGLGARPAQFPVRGGVMYR